MQDNRSRYLHNEGARRANEVRQRRATVENPQWAMSRPAEWYKNRENLRSVKDTLANVKGNRDFLTTDQDESRNMYQMIMNNMYGGGGARMLDTRGLPEGARRYGRTLFTDPAKSQGFFGDLGSLFSGKNKAAVRAPEWNPLHEEGYGRDWYKEQFPKTSGFMNLMEAVPKFLPGIGMASRIFGREKREPLPSDRSWIPEDVGSYKQVPMIDLEAMDRDINDGVGIAGVVDSDPEERAEYAAQTFGMVPAEIAALKRQIMSNPGTTDFGNLENLYGIKANTFDPEQYVLDNPPEIQTGIFNFPTDDVVEEVPTPELEGMAPDVIEPLPFDDTNREQAIANQYATNFIGPRDDPHRKPGMYDVAGPRLIDRGLIPYPSYLNEPIGVMQQGRGELPGWPNMYDYEGERKVRRDAYKLQELLDWINSQKTEEASPPFSIGASR